jgi:putative ABC transport system substrate-binding protein
MKKSGVLTILFAVVPLAVAVIAQAQQQAKVAKIGILEVRSPSGPGMGAESFRREFSALGYVEGKNIAFEHRFADYKRDRLPALAEELVRLKVDVLVAFDNSAAVAAKNSTRTLPIVFAAGVSDPVAAGLVDSLARPGGNITGLTNIAAVLAGKRLELLKETVPKIARVAVLWNPQGANAPQWKESQLAARELGLQLHSMEVSSASKFESAFKEAANEHSAALSVTQNSLFVSNQKQIADLAAKHRLPAIYPRVDYVVSGGLMSYGADESQSYRRLAIFVDKILKGTKPADLPVEQPTKFELIISLKAAKQIGLTIPPNVLARARRVIK